MEADPEHEIDKIISEFENDSSLLVSDAYGDGGTVALFARLRRAALNQADNGEATVSRYGIWGNTVRDHISTAIRAIESEDKAEALRLLTLAHNSMSAFSEIQHYFEPNKEV